MQSKKMPLVSVITPTYNKGYLLWKAIQSMQRQSYPNWEMIIVDDGSTDDTKKVVAEFQRDPRIKYIKNEKNGGQSFSRNVGLKNAQGDFIAYLDNDDVLYENYLSTYLAYFEKNPEKIFAVCNYNYRIELYDAEYKLIDIAESRSSEKDHITLQDYFHWNVKVFTTGIMHKAIAYKKGVKWDKTIAGPEDVDYILQLGEKFPNGFIHIPYVLCEFTQRYGKDSATSKTSYEKWAHNFEKIYLKYKNNPLMEGQSWYPKKIQLYRKMQEQLDSGELPPITFRFFPQYYKKDISKKS